MAGVRRGNRFEAPFFGMGITPGRKDSEPTGDRRSPPPVSLEWLLIPSIPCSPIAPQIHSRWSLPDVNDAQPPDPAARDGVCHLRDKQQNRRIMNRRITKEMQGFNL